MKSALHTFACFRSSEGGCTCALRSLGLGCVALAAASEAALGSQCFACSLSEGGLTAGWLCGEPELDAPVSCSCLRASASLAARSSASSALTAARDSACSKMQTSGIENSQNTRWQEIKVCLAL